MANLEKAPTTDEELLPKIFGLLKNHVMPGTKEYFEGLGASAEQNGITPTDQLPPIIRGLRDKFSTDAKKVIERQQKLEAVGNAVLKEMIQEGTKLQIAMATAPPMGVANRQYGIPYDKTQLRQAPETVTTDRALMPDTFDIDQLQGGPLKGFTQPIQAEGLRVPVPIREDRGLEQVQAPTFVGDEQAKMLPYQVAALQPIQAGHTVIDEDTGRALPYSMLKPQASFITGEEANAELDRAKAAGAIPAKDIPRFAPGSKVPTAMLSNLITQASNIYGKQTEHKNDRNVTQTMNGIALGLFNKDAREITGEEMVTPEDRARAGQMGVMIPPGPVKRLTALAKVGAIEIPTELAGMKASAQQQVDLSQPVTADEGANLFDREAFIKTGELVARPGVSKRESRGKDVLHISDKNLEQLSEVDKAVVSMGQITEFSKRVVTATTPVEAGIQAAKYMANSNPATRMIPGIYDAQMASYNDQVNALANGLAKAFGGERGVLTNVDVSRWVNALAKPGDTVEIRDLKSKTLEVLAQAAVVAQRRAIAGDAGQAKKIRQELSRQMDTLLSPLEQATGKGEKPKQSPQERFQELRKSMSKADAYKKMAEEGY